MKPPRQTRPSRFPGLWRATCGGGALVHVHYDETLRTAGPVNHYEIVNWFEDNVSHGAVGSTTAFWWAGSK